MGGNDLRDDSLDNREFANLAYGLRIADFNRRFERRCLRDSLRSILLGWFIYRPVMHVHMLRIAIWSERVLSGAPDPSTPRRMHPRDL